MSASPAILRKDQPIRSCRLCSATTLDLLFVVQSWQMYRCASCNLWQLGDEPSRSDLESLYSDSYFDRGKYVRDAALVREQQRRVRWMRNNGLAEGSRVLDAGCATGDFIEIAKHHFQMSGIDISPYAINQARKLNPEIAERLIAGLLEDQHFDQDTFDSIVLWDVIEHVWKPVEVLQRFAATLPSGRQLFLSTPNASAPIAQVMRSRWAFMTPPEHVSLFGKQTMSELLAASGFVLENWMTRGKWVNAGFFVHKLRKKFPSAIPAKFEQMIRSSSVGTKLLYVPTGDIQYVAARRK